MQNTEPARPSPVLVGCLALPVTTVLGSVVAAILMRMWYGSLYIKSGPLSGLGQFLLGLGAANQIIERLGEPVAGRRSPGAPRVQEFVEQPSLVHAGWYQEAGLWRVRGATAARRAALAWGSTSRVLTEIA